MSQVRRALSSLALPLTLAWGLGAACGYREPLQPIFGYENDDLSCSDHYDNDNDCLVDCEDPDCLVGSTICGELVPEPLDELIEDPTIICATIVLEDGTTQRDCSAQLGICRDRVDNDLNGQFDCGDRKCQDIFETGCLREATNELCSDGIDNDQNGFPDCQDFGCLRSPLVDVCSQGELRIEDGDRNLRADGESCASSVDTDNDGKIGCEDDCDRDCSPSIEELEALGLVDDPDLDYEHCCVVDDVIDLGACAYTAGCGSPENDAVSCSDGLDNDNDGYFDCGDYDCSQSTDAAVAELCDDTESGIGECTDGVDNDGDGNVDCADDECGQSTEQAILIHCNGMETSVLQCSDMVDNDNDGFVDCGDFDCSMSMDPAVVELCMGASGLQEPPVMGGVGAEDTLQTCSDMVDNDQDGFTDCEDFDCSMSMDQAILEYCASLAEDTLETCSDGIDNDGNGFTDCEDFDCSMSMDPAILEYCDSQGENTPEACSRRDRQRRQRLHRLSGLRLHPSGRVRGRAGLPGEPRPHQRRDRPALQRRPGQRQRRLRRLRRLRLQSQRRGHRMPAAGLLRDRPPPLRVPPRDPPRRFETIMDQRRTSKPLWLSCLGLLTLLLPAVAQASPWTPGVVQMLEPVADAAPKKEAVCDDGEDDDGDLVYDCGDADCKNDPACKPDGQAEYDDARCSDWVDNDEDGYVDCDDFDCGDSNACKGSWDIKPVAAGGTGTGTGTSTGAGGTATGGTGGGTATVKDGSSLGLKEGQTPDDLIGVGADADGERNNYFCSDGIDNDGDGNVDCADLGCRLDTAVTVCQGDSDFRFSLVARMSQTAVISNDSELQRNGEFERLNTEINSIQLRVLGQMPFIQNSFFLLSMRAERTPRMTFAVFQVPLGKKGHYINVNSGGGGLSLELVRSVHKRLLADPAFYVYNAFEQGNGAAVEFGGPLDKRGKFLYRAFAGGGSGRFNGNIGGRFFPDDNRNYTWSVGAQSWMNLVGYYSRWDSPFLYTPAPTTLAVAVGAKYDQRAQERYPAANVQAIFRWRRLVWMAETYAKRELNFKNWQVAYNTQVGVLPWKKRLMIAGDIGQYFTTEFEQPPEFLGSDLRRQLREFQYRAAAHVYLWRNVFFATLIWRDRRVEPNEAQGQVGIQKLQDLRLLLTYRW